MKKELVGVLAPLVRKLLPMSVEDLSLGRFARQNILPDSPTRPDESPFIPLGFLSTAGLDLHQREQLLLLERWKSPRYQELFQLLRNDPTINTNPFGHGKAAVHNGYFPSPDAEAYAAMILERRPRRIIEVGSGYSTRVARAAVQYGNLSTEIIVIDPSPRADVAGYADRVILSPVESSEAAQLAWTEEDLLFIDSSHVCRIRGDLPFLFCQVLPALPAGALVHFHDIFLPYDYPNVYDEKCYNEQYLLFCTLSYAPRYRTIYASHWLSRDHRDAMRETFGTLVGVDPLLFGASYWLDVQG
jgi:hypothetical protein